MPNRSSDPLFQLIHSLQKGEKRNFKLYMKRNSSNEDLKVIQLFDVLDKMREYDENVVLTKMESIKKEQLANRKAHLYRQILASLRLLETTDNIDIQLHEQLDYARILYNKGLYIQSLKILDKAKENARNNNQYSFLVQILFLEKKIESLHITHSLHSRAKDLRVESNGVVDHITLITKLSNLALELYGWYISNGHARNKQDVVELSGFFHQHLPAEPTKINGFYQKLYLYQSFCWYAFIQLDFLMYYRYTQKWVDLFHEEPFMIEIETAHYIKGLHNLISAHFDLNNFEGFDKTLKTFEEFSQSELVKRNQNNTIQVFVYLYIAKINRHFMQGSFKEGLVLVPYITEKLAEYTLYLDSHRILVFYYKIASLYFGSGDYDNTIKYLNKIINWKVNLRNDLQCYARLLHLIAHYELGNYNLLEYLIKSVYRFMAKMENLGFVEEEIFKFLQRSFQLTPNELQPEFKKLLQRLKELEYNPLATRAFAYLDIISWLESKIHHLHVQDILRQKYLDKMNSKNAAKGKLTS
ncbi:hypothetical protein [Flavisolibacter tropicus]|uniref:Uncharacterized protein n=1 Tax=Flavisolibacter tropicus TaxID=1492898 RepID=A0A172TS31_9BACT|nr:hypothetical protein [Flavisolibacter tropicus]ANE49684.1 hypothetical protein SY85_03405 [Flavisolibacter tropicus]